MKLRITIAAVKPLWTYTKFLTARPVRDSYGIIETPEDSGLITSATPSNLNVQLLQPKL